MQAEIVNEQSKAEFSKEMEEIIEKAINLVADEVSLGSEFEVCVTICDDEAIREINREHRNIDKSTDVLSFPMFSYSEPEVFEEDFFGDTAFGDIVISLETAIRQSEEYGHSAMREVSFLTIHSMLHLLGYDHIDEGDRTLMREKEEYYLEKMGQRR